MSVLPCVDAAAELREIKMAIYYINMQLFFIINKKRGKIVFVFKCNSKGSGGWVNSIYQAYKKPTNSKFEVNVHSSCLFVFKKIKI